MARSLEDINKGNHIVYGSTFDKDNLDELSKDIKNSGVVLKGIQTKWFIDDYYIKQDTPDKYEGLSEVIVSYFASCIKGLKYTTYYPCRIRLSDSSFVTGCYSANFRYPDETEYTFFDLKKASKYKGLFSTANDVASYLKAVIKLGIDIDKVIDCWKLDAITLNGDRHWDNLIVLENRNGRTQLSPVYDNGLALKADKDRYLLCDTFDDIINRTTPYISKYETFDEFMSKLKFDLFEIDIKKLWKIKDTIIPYYDTALIKERWELLLYNLDRTEGIYWREV